MHHVPIDPQSPSSKTLLTPSLRQSCGRSALDKVRPADCHQLELCSELIGPMLRVGTSTKERHSLEARRVLD